MDRVIIKKQSDVIIKKCGTCVYGKGMDLVGNQMQPNWVYCILWNAQKPFNGYCPQWKT